MYTVVTHSGDFHADDVFAVAAFQLLLGTENMQVVRTRDEEEIAKGDYIVDVGGEYDHARKRYDHHQNGAPVRENGIPYAGFGLMWKHYGAEICGSAEVAEKIEEKLCQQIDAHDNGVVLSEINAYGIKSTELSDFVKTWRADRDSDEDMDVQFAQIVGIMREYLARKITGQARKLELEKVARKLYEAAEDKTVLVSEEALPKSLFIETDTNVLVFPDSGTQEERWIALTVPVAEGSYESKVNFPESWAGLRDKALQDESGIADAYFCHKARFIFVAGSKESAVRAAQMAS